MFTIEEVAKLKDTTIKMVRRDIAAGLLPSIKKNNKIYVTHIDNYIPSTSFLEKSISKNKKTVDNVNWVDISKEMDNINAWDNTEQKANLNFVDLFGGAGGLSCGLVMAGFNPIGYIEIMESAVETYNRNFNKKEKPIDIRDDEQLKTFIKEIKKSHIHLISGGFPCQGFSMAGNRILNDERNSLYLHMLKIVEEVKPDFVLMENVVGLRSMHGGLVEQEIINNYKSIGYNINVTTLNSADYGVPQIRKRVIFIGNRLGLKNLHPQPIFDKSNYKTVADGIGRFADIPENKEINHIFTKHKKEIIKRLDTLSEGQSLYGNYSDAWKKVFWNNPSPTVKENHGGVHVHPKFHRVMTPRELASLQSFPDNFIFEGSKAKQLVQIGNAVPPLLGKAIGLAIRKIRE